MIKGVYIMPHPPLMVPGIGNADLIAKTILSVESISEDIAAGNPDTVIVITPHAGIFRDFIHLSDGISYEGSFADFGRKDIRLFFENDREMVSAIIDESKQAGLPVGTLTRGQLTDFHYDSRLDHGAMVPLYFIQKKYKHFRLVLVPVAGFGYEDLYRIGQLIRAAACQLSRKTVVVASADLSHKLRADGPYGYAKEGPLFDAKVMELVGHNDVEGLMTLDDGFVYKAAMCGLPSIVMAYGCLDGEELVSEILSYEGPYGVGYMTARIIPKGK